LFPGADTDCSAKARSVRTADGLAQPQDRTRLAASGPVADQGRANRIICAARPVQAQSWLGQHVDCTEASGS